MYNGVFYFGLSPTRRECTSFPYGMTNDRKYRLISHFFGSLLSPANQPPGDDDDGTPRNENFFIVRPLIDPWDAVGGSWSVKAPGFYGGKSRIVNDPDWGKEIDVFSDAPEGRRRKRNV